MYRFLKIDTLGAKSLSTIRARTPCIKGKSSDIIKTNLGYSIRKWWKEKSLPQRNQRKHSWKLSERIHGTPVQDIDQEFQIYLPVSKFISRGQWRRRKAPWMGNKQTWKVDSTHRSQNNFQTQWGRFSYFPKSCQTPLIWRLNCLLLLKE